MSVRNKIYLAPNWHNYAHCIHPGNKHNGPKKKKGWKGATWVKNSLGHSGTSLGLLLAFISSWITKKSRSGRNDCFPGYYNKSLPKQGIWKVSFITNCSLWCFFNRFGVAWQTRKNSRNFRKWILFGWGISAKSALT